MEKKLFTLCLLLSCFLFSCSNQEEAAMEKDYNEFKTWSSQQGERAESATEAEWAEVEREYNERSTNLDQRQDRMSEQMRRDYDETKTNFQNWSTRNREYTARQRQSQDTTRQNTGGSAASGKWSQTLLGQYSKPGSITAANARQVYITFMENVRAQHKNWSDADWDEADKVFDELDRQADRVEKQLSIKDRTKINALEMEYRALETGDEAKGTYKSVKD